jgi:CRISPR-associated endonuclease/helicase Cas3
MKETLQARKKKCVCISTRLIEAGVDIDFDTAIRFLAGLDSIIQTAGRCNRNGAIVNSQGNLITGKTYILNIVKTDEHIESLQELVLGQRQMERILREYHADEKRFNYTLLHPDIITQYFSYFYGALDDSLLKHKVFAGRDDTVLDLLSTNQESVSAFSRIAGSKYAGKIPPVTAFCQSFESAWNEFEAIASDTIGILVPYEKGKDVIAELYGTPDSQRMSELLRDGQQYSVNVHFNSIQSLVDQKIIKKIAMKPKLELYAVEPGYYDVHIGLSREFGTLSMLDA